MKIQLAILLFSGFAGISAPPFQPVKWALVGGNAPRVVVAGRVIDVVIAADIAEGWYIYSLTQKPGGPYPLRIQLTGAGDVGLRGAIKAPKPVTKFDANFGIETQLHRGKPQFVVPVGVPAGASGGKRELLVAARYQACSETLCLPPRTEKVALTLRIKGNQ